ncbi:hypothetical protein JCM10450v2_003466 [Rhodotorula kratochvilovae]
MVWPVHKLVCGSGKAKPVTWPGLTAQEADEAIAGKAHPSFGDAGLPALFQRITGVPSSGFDVRYGEYQRARGTGTARDADLATGGLRLVAAWVYDLDPSALVVDKPRGRDAVVHRLVVHQTLVRRCETERTPDLVMKCKASLAQLEAALKSVFDTRFPSGPPRVLMMLRMLCP